jgi:LssY C-terminus
MSRPTRHRFDGDAADPDARRSSRRARGAGNWPRFPAGLAAALLIAGCASFHPQPLDKVGFEQRAQSSTDGQVTASVTALTEDEARGALGVDISGAGIQPVWVKIENREAIGYVITPIVIDNEYFSPMEAAWQAHGSLSGGTNARIDEYFFKLHLPPRVGPGETVSGFVFTNLDKGVKYVSVELIGGGAEQVRRFAFLAKVPDLNADYLPLERESLHGKDEIKELDEAGFQAWVEQLPCCVLGGDRKTPGDPLNVVFVGEHSVLFPALARRGWHATVAITPESVWRTIDSSVFGSRYRYGPVSPLYALGRHQDLAVQKARSDINQRIHMRLWLAPIKLNGTSVWVGQISRDIGVELTRKTITTHKIDPQVDYARFYLIQDMFYSQSLRRYAHSPGVGAATTQSPHFNYTGDPYWTDGLRLVMWLSAEPVSYHQVEEVRWDAGPPRQ